MNRTTTQGGLGSTEYLILVVVGAIAVLLAVAQFGATLQDETIGADSTLSIELQAQP